MTREITVMRFESETDSCWVETKDLGGQSLFLDSKYAMSVSTSDVPELKRNCIYMISESSDFIRNVTAFDIERGVTWPCFSLNMFYRFFRPIWIMPSLLGTKGGTSISVGSKMQRLSSLFPGSNPDGSLDLSNEMGCQQSLADEVQEFEGIFFAFC